MAPGLRSIFIRRPKVSISIHDERETYTNGDRLHGCATVSSQTDRAFSSVEVAFVGTCQTDVDRSITAAGELRSGAIHHFLKLCQSDVKSKLPADSILRAGRQYDIPFAFTLPTRRSTLSCQHPRDSDEVRDAHLYLPPSLSDGTGNADALAPVMADVQYNVRVRISGAKEGSEDIASRAKSIWFVPLDSLPPSSEPAHLDDVEHTTETAKSLRCTLWMGKHGSLEVKSSEPQCLLSLAAGYTTLDVALDFAPGHCTTPRPPIIDSVSVSLEGTTFYACSTRKAFPSKASYLIDSTQGHYQESLKLCTMTGVNLLWDTNVTSGHQSAHMRVPIVLPQNKKIAPTFHSCLISRTYTLRLRLKLKTGGSTSVELNVPVHVSMNGVEVLDKKRSLAFEDKAECCWDIDPVPTYSVRHDVDTAA